MSPQSIPSPSSGTIDIGPLSLTAYGLMIALGVIAAVWLFGRRLEAREAGTRDDSASIAIWAVLAGLIGARLYHVITDWSKFEGNLGEIPKVWEGGLGIPGGLIAGIPVGLLLARQRRIPMAVTATCAAPALPLAQAIGRWGNYWNQELFGKATDLPWGLEIDPENFVSNDPPGTTFHPTFLYESVWNLLLCGVLLWVDRRVKLAPGALIGVYLMGYGAGRFWVEGLRIDEADHMLGLRWNQWMALIFVVLGAAVLAVMQRLDLPWSRPAAATASDDGLVADTDEGLAAGADVDDSADTDVDDSADTDVDDSADTDADVDAGLDAAAGAAVESTDADAHDDDMSADGDDVETGTDTAQATDEPASSPGEDQTPSRTRARRRGARPD